MRSRNARLFRQVFLGHLGWNAALLLAVLTIVGATRRQVEAAGSVELELVTEKGFPPTEVQRWFQKLTELEVGGLRVREARGDDQVEVTVAGTKASPVYRVKGVLTARGQLVVPGGRFSVSDGAGLSRWLKDLREWGPQGSPTGKPLFGLNAQQFQDLNADLATLVTFSTVEMERRDAVERLRKALEHEVAIDRETLKLFEEGDPVGLELQGLAAGTSLAYALRPLGLTFRPERLASGQIKLVVRDAQKEETPWPIGWPLTKRSSEALPQLMEFVNVEIEPTPLSDVLPLLAGRLKVPYLIDQNSLVKHDVELAEVEVSFPKKRAWYEKILKTVLNQAQLKHEVRTDEAGQPFLWITTQKQ